MYANSKTSPPTKRVFRFLPASSGIAVSPGLLARDPARAGVPAPARSARRDVLALLLRALSGAVRPSCIPPRRAVTSRGQRRLRGLCCGALLAVTPGALPSAAAQTTHVQSRVAVARDEFRRAFSLAQEGRWAEALAAYERSERLRPHPLTTYNIALCERALRRNTRARRAFLRALTESRGGADMRGKEADAWTHVRAIEREIARLTLTIEPADAAIRVDGRPLEGDLLGGAQGTLVAGTLPEGPGRQAPAARFEVLLDAGRHEIELSRPGYIGRRVSWSAAEGASGALALTLTPAPRPERDRNRVYAGVSLASLGALGLITGTIFGARTLVLKNEANQLCKSGCNRDGLDADHKSKTSANIATATFFPGLVLAGSGMLLLAGDDPTRSAGQRSGTHLTAVAGRNGAFFTLGHFW
ncbi:hypothetical protein [Sorangium sp. So ce131]|uniref:hypothetical protein n=1 Tax=Sorangium sp. So ce131 TaxID=3133282 RepID=UPI003F60A348